MTKIIVFWEFIRALISLESSKVTVLNVSFSTKTSDTEKYFYSQVCYLIEVTVDRLRYVAYQNASEYRNLNTLLDYCTHNENLI